jgi:hypothetical protein
VGRIADDAAMIGILMAIFEIACERIRQAQSQGRLFA